MNPLQVLGKVMRMNSAERYGRRRGAPGMDFYSFGRRTGSRLLLRGIPSGLIYWLTPVAMFRYFEFPFAWEFVPKTARRCLDVASPRLFTAYVASHTTGMTIHVVNPDHKDAVRTRSLLSGLGLGHVTVEESKVETMSGDGRGYDCIWSISVIEHVQGQIDDREAVHRMFGALRAGGRLILSVPVDRAYREDYRDHDVYRLGRMQAQRGRFFFQRVYDKASLWQRIVATVGSDPVGVGWFGETVPGRYKEYETRWINEGWSAAIEDPIETADFYREFPTWEAMPGFGVCGLVFDKGPGLARPEQARVSLQGGD